MGLISEMGRVGMKRVQIRAAFRHWSNVIEKSVCCVIGACKYQQAWPRKSTSKAALTAASSKVLSHFVAIGEVELVIHCVLDAQVLVALAKHEDGAFGGLEEDQSTMDGKPG